MSTGSDMIDQECRGVYDLLPDHSGYPLRARLAAAERIIGRLEDERKRLSAWLVKIDGGDSPCLDEGTLRQWAYTAIVIGGGPEDYA